MFYLSCSNIVSHHCALCYANSTCKSCYIAGSGYTPNVTYDGYVYSSTDGRCLTECGNGYFTNTLGVCAPCDVTCEKCSVSSTSCTSCNTSSSYNKFDAVNKACLTACPIGFYADSSSTCVACSNTCRTCAVISTNCTSCIGVLYLSGTTCVDSSSCGYGKYANSLTNNCSLCGVSCTTCLGSANNCTACSAGYIYLNNLTLTNTTFACTNICPTGTVNDTVHGCYCQAPCATCVTTIDKCLSCTTGNNLLNNVCLPTCPSSTYASGGSCVSCPANCDSCSSPTCQ